MSMALGIVGGGGGIRTPGWLITIGCFQDSCNQPLCHLSVGKNRKANYIAKDDSKKKAFFLS